MMAIHLYKLIFLTFVILVASFESKELRAKGEDHGIFGAADANTRYSKISAKKSVKKSSINVAKIQRAKIKQLHVSKPCLNRISKPHVSKIHARKAVRKTQIHASKTQKLNCTTSSKYSALVVNASTRQIIYANRMDDRRYPASTTKVMTLFILFDHIKNGKISLNDYINIFPASARQEPSKLGLKPHSKITVRSAIDALIVKSANDVSHAVAMHLGGSIKGFAAMMNRKAASLGMRNSQFVNPHGLFNAQQYTTTRDLAILTIAIQKQHKSYFHFFSRKNFRFGNRVISGHNNVLKKYRWANGLKTGYIRQSGFNLITTANKNNVHLVGVVLGCPTAHLRDSHMIELLEAAYKKADNKRIRG